MFHTTPHASRHPDGFTLIEILVVISIIALLVSILLLALSSARDTAKRMLCMNNQRQILIAQHTYAYDYKQNLPPRISSTSSPAPPARRTRTTTCSPPSSTANATSPAGTTTY